MTPHNILYINLTMLKCNQYDVNCTVHDVWRPTIHQVKHIARSKWLGMLNFWLFSKLCKSPSNTYRKQIKQTASGTIHELEMKLHKSNISLLVIQTTGIWVTVITQCYAYLCLTQLTCSNEVLPLSELLQPVSSPKQRISENRYYTDIMPSIMTFEGKWEPIFWMFSKLTDSVYNVQSPTGYFAMYIPDHFTAIIQVNLH